MKKQGDVQDPLEELSYFVYTHLNKWYNPLERMTQRHNYINQLADEFNDYLFGESTYKDLSPSHIKERSNIPVSIEDKQLVDMYYIWNEHNNSTVLVTLLHGGIVASFRISDDYFMEHHRESKPQPE